MCFKADKGLQENKYSQMLALLKDVLLLKGCWIEVNAPSNAFGQQHKARLNGTGRPGQQLSNEPNDESP